MSDSLADSVRQLQRALREQQRTIFNLRSQVIDHRAVIIQNLTRIEALEGYASNVKNLKFTKNIL